MTAFVHLWRREIAAWFRTSGAYVIGVFFLILTGFSFWMMIANQARGAPATELAGGLFGTPWFWLAMLTVCPLLTMRLFAEERRLGTLEMLLTAPVTETEVVLAKFAGAYCALLLLWLPTLAHVFIIRRGNVPLPPIDWGALAAGYLGAALVGAFFLSVGLLSSLLTRHQAIAAMGCLAVLGVLLSAGWLPAYFHSEHLRLLVQAVSAPAHMRDFAAGIIDTRAVVWYASATALLLFVSIRLLEARRLR